jgi:hypothetical protein
MQIIYLVALWYLFYMMSQDQCANKETDFLNKTNVGKIATLVIIFILMKYMKLI